MDERNFFWIRRNESHANNGINFSLEGNWRQYEGVASIRDPGVPANVIVEDPTFLLIRKLSKVKHGVEVDITIW